MNCVIIGSTKIAEVHAEQLVKNGVKELTFISRSVKKRKKIIFKLKKRIAKKVLFFHSDIKILKKNFFNIICICSNTEVHHRHLRIVSGSKSIIIVEKPIISLLKFKNRYEEFLKNIYKKNKRIVVCYPYLFLAKSFNKFCRNIKKINRINFEFQTGGKATFKKICINLMPHALSFFYIFLKKNFLKEKINKTNLLVKKHMWQVGFKASGKMINLIFKENHKKKTSLKLTLNDLVLMRKTKKNKGRFTNYIQNYQTNKTKNISNPMEMFYKDLFKNINNKKYYKTNKYLTFNIMKKNNFFLN
tara:strand:- start:3540 stop:4445 length:906 start_codon:yes stop_codon:yes gene_type:complete